MHTFAQKPKTTQQTSSTKSTMRGRAHIGQSREVSSILHPQRTTDSQGGMRVLQAEPKHFENSARTTNITPLGRTFSKFNRPPADAKWRMPQSANLQALLAADTVDEAVVHSRVRRLLDRMTREGRLSDGMSISSNDIDVVMAEIFPTPGTLDQAAYDRHINPTDQTIVYNSVHDASATPRAADRTDLRNAMQSAATTAQTAATDEAELRAVFGPTEWTTARINYGLIHDRLTTLSADIENRISTDYNLDAQETFLGGWASFNNQHIHLRSEVIADPLTAESKVTLLHEAAHLASSSIKDHVYYGTTGFEAKDHATKITNAAHYEEIPRRIWSVSRYPGQTFTPGVSSSGVPLTTEEQIRAGGAEYYRLAWDAAADFDDLIKQARRNQLDGTTPNENTVARLLEVSPLMDLTLHEQRSSPLDITQLDITTSESIVRAMGMAGHHIRNLTNVMPMGPFSSTAEEITTGVRQTVLAAMAAYGGLLDDATRDSLLMDWLHSHYKDVFP